MGMYDYDDYTNFLHESVLDGDLYDGTEKMQHPTTCWECKQLKKEVKKLQQLVELLQLPNDFE
jgi:hypothetical protein